MKTKTFLLAVISIFSLLLVYFLHYYCLEQNINIGNFERNFKSIHLKKKKIINLKTKANYIVGTLDEYLFTVENDLMNIRKLNLETNEYNLLNVGDAIHSANIIDQNIYILNPITKFLTKINSFENNNTKKSKLKKIVFDRGIAMDSTHLLLRSPSKKNNKINIFSIYNVNTFVNKKTDKQLKDSLEIDGGLKSDGYFVNDGKNQIVYTQYKKGGFYVFSINSKSSKYIKSIDNTEIVKGFKMDSDSTFFFDRPTINVNILTRVFNNKIYNVSGVKGKKDGIFQFNKNLIVDLYNITNNSYEKSFLLPNNDKEKPIDFLIRKNELILLFKDKIIIYDCLI